MTVAASPARLHRAAGAGGRLPPPAIAVRICAALTLLAWLAGAVRYARAGGSFSGVVVALALLAAAAGGWQLRGRPEPGRYAEWLPFLFLLEFLPEHLLGGAASPKAHALPAVAALLWMAGSPRVRWGGPSRPGALLAAFTVVYCAVGTTLAILKLQAFGYVGQDVAYFMQCLHTALRGHLFWANQYHDLLYSQTVASDFAGHNQPVLFLLLPFYALAPRAETLFLVRNAVLALSAWPLYRLCRFSLPATASALLTAAFLLAPAVLFQNFYDFAPLSLAVWPLCWALVFLRERRFRLFVSALLGCLSVREDLVFAVAGLGLLAALERRPLRWSALPVLAACAWAGLTWKLILPHFQHGAASAVESCFAYLGPSPLQTMAAHPGLVLTRNTESYLLFILTPFGLVLPFASFLSAIALVYLAINVLGDAGCDSAIVFRHYALVPTVLLLPGVLACLQRLRRPAPAALFLLATSVVSTALLLNAPELAWWRRAPWQTEARAVAAALPPGAAVAVPRYMLPLAANRELLFQSLRLLDYHHPAAEYVVLDADDTRSDITARTAPGYRRLQGLLAGLPVVYASADYRVYKAGGHE